MVTTLPRPQTLTLASALRVIRSDGQVVEQQPWDMLWFVHWDSYPSDRHMIKDMTEAGVIEYAQAILWGQWIHQREA